jgi:hypothetical protein
MAQEAKKKKDVEVSCVFYLFIYLFLFVSGPSTDKSTSHFLLVRWNCEYFLLQQDLERILFRIYNSTCQSMGPG